MRIAVAGAGAWGTALAMVAARAGRPVTLWARDPALAAAMRESRENRRHLPGQRLAGDIEITAERSSLGLADLVLLCVPAQAMREAAQALAGVLPRGCTVVACAKGIEVASGKWMTEVLAESLPDCVPAILSGPSFAEDVARGLPTAVTVAARERCAAEALAEALAAPGFRLYHTQDVRGVEIGGAAKNVLAIASGMVAGRSLGASAQAALIARSFAELRRFGLAHGGRHETLTGLSGLGDLVLTCNSPQSRNFSLGQALGRGETLSTALADGRLVEGVFTAEVLVARARASGIAMPIAESVDTILRGKSTIAGEIEALLARPQRAED